MPVKDGRLRHAGRPNFYHCALLLCLITCSTASCISRGDCPSSIRLGRDPSQYFYYFNISFGTPPQHFGVSLDTGSADFGLPLPGCMEPNATGPTWRFGKYVWPFTGKHFPGPFYRSNDSTTSRPVLTSNKDDVVCFNNDASFNVRMPGQFNYSGLVKPSPKLPARNDYCITQTNYGKGAFTAIVISDTLHLFHGAGATSVPVLVPVSGMYNLIPFVDQAEEDSSARYIQGIMGAAYSNVASSGVEETAFDQMLLAIGKRGEKAFTVCLGHDGGKLYLSRAPKEIIDVSRGNMQYFPVVPQVFQKKYPWRISSGSHFGLYNLHVVDILLGGRSITIQPSKTSSANPDSDQVPFNLSNICADGKCIVDTGQTWTKFPSFVMDGIIDRLAAGDESRKCRLDVNHMRRCVAFNTGDSYIVEPIYVGVKHDGSPKTTYFPFVHEVLAMYREEHTWTHNTVCRDTTGKPLTGDSILVCPSPREQSDDGIILGQDFLRGYVVEFDKTRHRVGFAAQTEQVSKEFSGPMWHKVDKTNPNMIVNQPCNCGLQSCNCDTSKFPTRCPVEYMLVDLDWSNQVPVHLNCPPGLSAGWIVALSVGIPLLVILSGIFFCQYRRHVQHRNGVELNTCTGTSVDTGNSNRVSLL